MFAVPLSAGSGAMVTGAGGRYPRAGCVLFVLYRTVAALSLQPRGARRLQGRAYLCQNSRIDLLRGAGHSTSCLG
jgi:hypothetical protein